MPLTNLTPATLLALGRRAALVSVGRLDQLARRADPSDRALLQLLADRTAEERAVLEAFPAAGTEEAARLDPAQEERLLREHLPSAKQSLGEGWLGRDVALYFTETLCQESALFYRALAELARTDPARIVFERVARVEERQLDRLRTVLLTG
jgi:chorismate mutase